MYSRYSTPSSREALRVPENYSGCAFSKASAAPTPPVPPPVVKAPLPIPVPTTKEEQTPALPPPPPPTPPKAEREGILSWIKDGEEFDRFLILGLIALLLHSGEDKEIVLWLSLLLFC
jgi:hypothetical protein